MKKYSLALIAFIMLAININAQKILPSDILINQALKKAKSSNKKVFVIFHASWCYWCRRMDSCMNDESTRSFFDRNFEIVHLTIMESNNKKDLENPGAIDVYKKYGGKDLSGIPYWLILSNDGNFIADARLPNGQNIGCPATAREVDYFLELLKKATVISPQELHAIELRFRKGQE
ncbi:MAG: thioredoxin family protein [Flavisolibacter sp.]